MPTIGTHIEGPTLCGFFRFFEIDFGDPNTPTPLATVIPSRVGAVLLPFRCPGCGKIQQELADPEVRERYHDDRIGRNNYWCPSCGYRFKIDLRGESLKHSLPAGAEAGPSRVVRGDKEEWQDTPGTVSQILGFIVTPILITLSSGKQKHDYIALAQMR